MNQDEQDIRDLIATWLSATKTGDKAKVLELVADDVIFLMPGQAPMRGRAAFAAMQGTMGEFTFDSESTVEEVQVVGEWAYCWTTLAIAITPHSGGGTIKRSGNTLSILKKIAGKWVLFRDANMLTAVKS